MPPSSKLLDTFVGGAENDGGGGGVGGVKAVSFATTSFSLYPCRGYCKFVKKYERSHMKVGIDIFVCAIVCLFFIQAIHLVLKLS